MGNLPLLFLFYHQINTFILKRDTPLKNEDLVGGSNLELLNETLFQYLKDHQIKSVGFKWEASFKSYSTNGCILNVY
jgi:hypothetical protein